ncbi:uncharacterized protein K441DRAFT_614615 [Cenococcum geophilum 1.58]|uniref:uncharacterized protein n=1 Tax=Cenococcum geophilum 1.58 TaxID=794803 RepID=UPI00358EA695|nr:hypothetical protein K441DRAFT_614615 [Cenococcum geophilum 1.58]
MFVTTSPVIGFLLLAASVLASASPLLARATSSDSFGLYAYGSGIGGLPVFYSDGNAYIGHGPPPNASSSANITLTKNPNDSVGWIANPNTTTSSNATWADASFYVPSPEASSHQVGFTSNATSDQISSGFAFYGHVTFLVASSGGWEALFYAKPTASSGIWSLMWNQTGETDSSAVPVALKDSAPPTL